MVLLTLNYLHFSRHQSQPNRTPRRRNHDLLPPKPRKEPVQSRLRRDLTEMNPEEMESAYVAPWEKTDIAALSPGDL